MMEENSLNEYERQLRSVEEALARATSESDITELRMLKENLEELLLLTFQETELKSEEALKDEQVKKFLAELSEETGDDKQIDASNGHDDTDDGTEALLRASYELIKPELDALVGSKCSAPHTHTWGVEAYHNALVCGITDVVNLNEDGELDVQVKVLYVNPTHREMLPCQYFLEGECRFSDEQCHYSHGENISHRDIKEYNAPDFEMLKRNCMVLAKLDDKLWHRGRVVYVHSQEKKCRVRLDSRQHKQRELDIMFKDLLPMYQDDDLDSDTDDDNRMDSDSSSDSDMESDDVDENQKNDSSMLTIQPSRPLGEWEKYTKGIGSKLMNKMGYVHGQGLGANGEGIVLPIAAQVLPQGRSLDHCMNLREAANGDKNLFSVEKKLLRDKKKQDAINAKAYENYTEKSDIFTFINKNVLTTAANVEEKPTCSRKAQENLKQQTTKTLNVESVRIADDIRRKEREISKLEESMKRNSSNSGIRKHFQVQLAAKNQELANLKSDERKLSKEQDSRKKTGKLSIF